MFLKSLGAAIAALILAAACGPQARGALTPVEGDSTLGPADAKVTVTEYLAPTCPVCKYWHDKYWAEMKAGYIDTGKIRFVARELPSHNRPVDAAIFGIARCVGSDYFAVLDKAFEQQLEIEQAARSGGAQAKLVSFGKQFGLSEGQVESCVKDPKSIQRIYDVEKDANERAVSGTPTFFVNDQMIDAPTIDEVWPLKKATIDALLTASAPAPAPATAPAPAETPPAPGQQ